MEITREMILGAEPIKDYEKIPLLDCIYIIFTNEDFDEDYKKMEMVGVNHDLHYLKKIDVCSDVIDFGENFNIHGEVEIQTNLFKIFCRKHQFLITGNTHTFSFELIEEK